MSGLEQVVGPGAVLGEGPVWDEREGILWWLDIPGKALHRYDPTSGDDEAFAFEDEVGSLVPRASGGLVLATPNGFEAFDTEKQTREVLAVVEQENDATRMKDGKCDRQGRFWAGTMAYDGRAGAGSLYRLDDELSVTTHLTDVAISNGLAWSADDSTLFYIDTMANSVDAFDFDARDGTIANRRKIIEIPAAEGLPDGMCIDAEGYLWVALYDGGAVRRYSPGGTLDRIVEVPAAQVTCCAFAGPDLDELYITTAAQGFTDADRKRYPDAGALYRIRPGVAGTPVNTFAG
jgi:sugar lactone lactonase YvrE